MRFLGVVFALAFVVLGLAPTQAQAQNQLMLGKTLTVGTRHVSDWWMKVDYEPRDSRRGDPGGDLPPGLDHDVQGASNIVVPGAALAAPAAGHVVDPGSEMIVETRKVDDFAVDVKQGNTKTTGDLPPGIERDGDASSSVARQGVDLLGADRRVRAKNDSRSYKAILRPAYDRAAPASMGGVRSAPRENAVRGVRGYKANRFE